MHSALLSGLPLMMSAGIPIPASRNAIQHSAPPERGQQMAEQAVAESGAALDLHAVQSAACLAMPGPREPLLVILQAGFEWLLAIMGSQMRAARRAGTRTSHCWHGWTRKRAPWAALTPRAAILTPRPRSPAWPPPCKALATPPSVLPKLMIRSGELPEFGFSVCHCRSSWQSCVAVAWVGLLSRNTARSGQPLAGM